MKRLAGVAVVALLAFVVAQTLTAQTKADFDALTTRVANLEKRVAALEKAQQQTAGFTVSSGSYVLNAGTGSVTISAGSIKLDAASVLNLKGAGSVTLESTGPTSVRGSLVKLNGGGRPAFGAGAILNGTTSTGNPVSVPVPPGLGSATVLIP